MKKYYSFLLLLAITLSASANNVQLTNISVSNNVTNTGKVIQFDLSWENSWRTASTGNYDGVWVFFKFKDYDGIWKHLNFTTSNVTLPSGVSHSFGNNGTNLGVGMFLYRSNNGTGTFSIINAKAGITSVPGTYDLRGFALEMVDIPQASFYIGDSSGFGYDYKKAPGIAPYLVNGNGASITVGNANGNLKDGFNGYLGNLQGFPTGYNEFWCMKYELSRAGFRDFLNCLTYAQQANLFFISKPPSSATGSYPFGSGSSGLSGNDIEIKTPGIQATNTGAVIGCDFDNDDIFDESTDGEWKAVNVINWAIEASYLDWAGLRPMTEMEFEKICRGPSYPLPDEYPWGTASVDTNNYILTNAGKLNELVSNTSSIDGNAFYNVTALGGQEPLRSGIFANAFSSRVSSGASYYGVMEMGGNVIELCVTSHNPAGRSFTGKNGNGFITTHGYADENNWPGINGVTDTSQVLGVYDGGIGVRTTAGLLERGSYFSGPELYMQISSRVGAFILNGGGSPISNSLTTYYSTKYGIRGVRDAN